MATSVFLSYVTFLRDFIPPRSVTVKHQSKVFHFQNDKLESNVSGSAQKVKDIGCTDRDSLYLQHHMNEKLTTLRSQLIPGKSFYDMSAQSAIYKLLFKQGSPTFQCKISFSYFLCLYFTIYTCFFILYELRLGFVLCCF